jgi:hypothetical protein
MDRQRHVPPTQKWPSEPAEKVERIFIMARLGQKLREVNSDAIRAPLPNEMREALERLRHQEQ